MKRFISEEEGIEILKAADYGVLSMVTPEGEAYGVTVNHVYLPEENAVFFHCAVKGKKLSCILAHPQVSFTACVQEEVIPETFNTRYKSVIINGAAGLVEGAEEKRALLRRLCARFCPGQEKAEEVISRSLSHTAICKIKIDSITAKHNAGN